MIVGVSGALTACKDGKPTLEETATICATVVTLPGVTPSPTPPPTPEPTPCCQKGFAPEPDPGDFLSTEAYLEAQAQYAQGVTSAYTQDERLVARMTWWEQKNRGPDAMRAAAWSVVRRKNDTTYFGHVNTIQAVLEDRQCSSADTSGMCVQYQGYWRSDPLPHIARKWQGDGDRDAWFQALDTACKVLNNCVGDPTRGYLWWGNGESAKSRMDASVIT